VLSITLECAPLEKELLVAEFHELGTAGVTEEDLPDGRVRLRAFFSDEPDGLLSRFADYRAEVRREEPRDWVAESRAPWAPVEAGQRFYLVPPWREDPTPPGRIRLEMPAGMASGTGLHPATQLALEGLERTLSPSDLVFDLGAGSGILSIAAHRLGAGRIVACDLDQDAVAAARVNCRNAGALVALFAGSTRSLRAGAIDLLVANISGTAIAGLAAEFRRLLAAGGRAVLAGFTLEEGNLVRRTLAVKRLAVRQELEKSGWMCLICEREE
jgi:ribosomal protein L11 methyltransferase